ncbi:Hypothetical_protein [Hexamita inflata]|uniref:Hypothetical_protein n=1 Tax=Hexamita inflata TaxID=28002 RepID=A0AA86Q3W1_9EUKA|nr:Hypothetical protein HINF_LOCUS39410 [Hexamita inflata]
MGHIPRQRALYVLTLEAKYIYGKQYIYCYIFNYLQFHTNDNRYKTRQILNICNVECVSKVSRFVLKQFREIHNWRVQPEIPTALHPTSVREQDPGNSENHRALNDRIIPGILFHKLAESHEVQDARPHRIVDRLEQHAPRTS